MKFKRSLFLTLFLFVFSALPVAKANEKVPAYYDEAKRLITVLANQDDPDSDSANAQLELCKKGPDIIPALALLFQENPSDEYRKAILNTLSKIDGDISAFIPTINMELAKSADNWKNDIWVGLAVRLFTKIDPESGRKMALKALESDHPFTLSHAIQSLAKNGKPEDEAVVSKFASARRAKKGDFSEELAAKADKAASEIRVRSAQNKP
jgi:hypothetical protein